MCLSRYKGPVLCSFALLLLAGEACGGKLRNTEKKATASVPAPAPKKPKTETKSISTITEPSFSSAVAAPAVQEGDSFLGGFFAWLIAAPFDYQPDDPSASPLNDSEDHEESWAGRIVDRFPLHELGDATVPYARFDYNYQRVDSDIDADDFRVEAGYKWLAFHGRATRFSDSSDGFKLDMDQYYGVVRYGGWKPLFIPGTFEAAIGLGVSQISGDEDHTSGAVTIPLKYYPVVWGGIEFRPAWYQWDNRSIGDYDLSASFGSHYLHVRGGYRAMWMEGEGRFNDGPYAGLSVSF
jgi:hypothetical protein